MSSLPLRREVISRPHPRGVVEPRRIATRPPCVSGPFLAAVVLVLAGCTSSVVFGVVREDRIPVKCRGMPEMSSDLCGLFGDAALASLGGHIDDAATVAIVVTAPHGQCARASATVRDGVGRAIGTVSLACPTH